MSEEYPSRLVATSETRGLNVPARIALGVFVLLAAYAARRQGWLAGPMDWAVVAAALLFVGRLGRGTVVGAIGWLALGASVLAGGALLGRIFAWAPGPWFWTVLAVSVVAVGGTRRGSRLGYWEWTVLAVAILYLTAFLVYPTRYVLEQAFVGEKGFTTAFVTSVATNPIVLGAITNSLVVAIAVTAFTTLVAVPLALVMARYRLPLKGLWATLLLVPLVLPPFVGAIGFRRMIGRFGTLNILLMKLGILAEPVDWFGAGSYWGVVLLEALHLYPIMYLSLAAALANVDPSLEDAARNLGASPWRVFRRVTLPLALPGYFAGATIVFIWAFTDLGTPLMFRFRRMVPVIIFERITQADVDPTGYVLVLVLIVMTLGLFYLSRLVVGGRRYEMMSRAATGAAGDRQLAPATKVLALVGIVLLVGLALTPHLGVVLTSVGETWYRTALPTEWTLQYYEEAVTHDLAAPSIRNSLLFSSASTIVDLGMGLAIAYLVVRRRFAGRALLATLAMLPLALPGLVLAFGYYFAYGGTFLYEALPHRNPAYLLVISYSVRRLPYMIRAAVAGLQQTSVTLEEAATNLGAGPLRTLRRITLPLVGANLIAGGILVFSFAMLEVSDSLILTSGTKEAYPLTRAIYEFANRLMDGPMIASAMGVVGMVILTLSLAAASALIGRKMGQLFRA